GMKQMQHDVKCQEVEDRAYWPQDQHEVADEVHVPVPGLDEIFFIDTVKRDRDLRNIVEKIVQQDLYRQHGKKGQEERCSGHAEHVPEIGTRSHHNVFHDVAVGAPAFHDSFIEHVQILLQKDHLRSAFC